MSYRSAAAIALAASLISPAASADDGDDGFFSRIKILGSSTGQVQKDNASLSGGIGISGENTNHFLYILINAGFTQNAPEAGEPATAYGQYLLSPPSTDASLTGRYRYFRDKGNATLGAFGQLDVGRGDISGMVGGSEIDKEGFAIALDAGVAGQLVISRNKSLFLFGFAGISTRFLGGDAARDDELLMATFGSTTTSYFGANASVLLQLGEVFAGLQVSYLSGDVAGLSGAQLVPIVGLRGGFDISSPDAPKPVTRPMVVAPPTEPPPEPPLPAAPAVL